MVTDNFEVVPATVFHIEHIVDEMTAMHRKEVWALSHLSPREALVYGLSNSEVCWAVEVDGRAILLFGVFRQTSEIGSLWLLASDRMKENIKPIVYNSKRYIDVMLLSFQRLDCKVMVENKSIRRWLRWLGFSSGETSPHGVENKEFIPFWKERDF